MSARNLRLVVLGLSLSSSWGNGHATTYRALLKALAERGHSILFLERDVPWYADHRDLTHPRYCELAFYKDLGGLRKYQQQIAAADAVIIGSYVPQGINVIGWVLGRARGVTAFYDIDTPVTVAAIKAGTCEYLTAAQIPQFDLYLSFTGGPMLTRLRTRYGARRAAALYCSADADLYRPRRATRRWDLGYLGTYSPDRQPALERLLFEPARRLPNSRFVVAGAQYPSSTQWPDNVEHIPHLPPDHHAEFYSSLGWALNITRREMVAAGYSPSVRLFEAGACGAPLISDASAGLDTLFVPRREIVFAKTSHAVVQALTWPEERRAAIAHACQRRFLREHSSRHRAAELEHRLLSIMAVTGRELKPQAYRPQSEPKQGTYVSRQRVLT